LRGRLGIKRLWDEISRINLLLTAVNAIFIPRRKYGNAAESDLWEALTEETRGLQESFLPANLTVKQVMDTWTKQDGYPVLSVTRDYNNGSARLSQVSISITGM
jgi:aminopeptidase N